MLGAEFDSLLQIYSKHTKEPFSKILHEIEGFGNEKAFMNDMVGIWIRHSSGSGSGLGMSK